MGGSSPPLMNLMKTKSTDIAVIYTLAIKEMISPINISENKSGLKMGRKVGAKRFQLVQRKKVMKCDSLKNECNNCPANVFPMHGHG